MFLSEFFLQIFLNGIFCNFYTRKSLIAHFLPEISHPASRALIRVLVTRVFDMVYLKHRVPTIRQNSVFQLLDVATWIR